MNPTTFREIEPGDNLHIAKIIRESLAEFGANRKGTVYYDDTTDHLFELFRQERSVYYIAQQENEIVGGGGIFPSAGLPGDTCELVKMYLKAEVRGMGIGRKLIDMCLRFAAAQGYKQVYLETMPELKKALGVYEKQGFNYLGGPLGNTGHFGCEIWMLKRL